MNSSFRIMRSAFTLLEILIVVAVIAILGSILIILLNPKKQIQKTWDGQRKNDLATAERVFEDFYNDNQAYPKGDGICYDSVSQNGDTCSCHVCGKEGAKNFSPYVRQLFCDPEYPRKTYLYQYKCSDASWYQMCAWLWENMGRDPNYFNFGIASQNIDWEICKTILVAPDQPLQPTTTPTPGPTIAPTATPIPPTATPVPTATPTPTPIGCPQDPQSKYCFRERICNNCGQFANCYSGSSCDIPVTLYSDFNCRTPCF